MWTHLHPLQPRRPLILYLSVLDNSFGSVLGQHDGTGKKYHIIYYLNNKLTIYESKYILLERTCCTLTWVAQKLQHYILSYTTYVLSRMDSLKYIFQKTRFMGRLVKRNISLIEFDIIYMIQPAKKSRALADHLAGNLLMKNMNRLRPIFLMIIYHVLMKLFLIPIKDGSYSLMGPLKTVVRIGYVIMSELGDMSL